MNGGTSTQQKMPQEKKIQTTDTCNNMDESPNNFTKWKKRQNAHTE